MTDSKGAGKGYTMNKLVEKGRFPLLAFIHVDPDEVRRFVACKNEQFDSAILS